ncbi:hypothetical protein KXR53_31770 [Inquilinus limosus]|uniref:hypothetical protein n=1 Tax=Inquilinus limosus TaxID=171674 RepID=UPI003F15D0B7
MTTVKPVLSRHTDFAAVLTAGEDEAASTRLRRAEQIGSPLGDQDVLDRLERRAAASSLPPGGAEAGR